jgi:hypothetical protein
MYQPLGRSRLNEFPVEGSWFAVCGEPCAARRSIPHGFHKSHNQRTYMPSGSGDSLGEIHLVSPRQSVKPSLLLQPIAAQEAIGADLGRLIHTA